jgi:hypothetical protein
MSLVKNAAQIKEVLARFSGSESYHKFSPLSRLVVTDGVKWLADNAECYWLLNEIASYQHQCSKDAMLRDFQVWTLTTEQRSEMNRRGHLKCERDTGDKKPIRQEIEYTDFPLDEIKLYVENGVILLPSER